MKILKVIVDKVPSGCAECKFFDINYNYELRTDFGREVRLCTLNTVELGIFAGVGRPDWCPLVLEGEMVIVIGEPLRHRKRSEDEDET